jgi:uncharacterized peroxidase-related enzyme
MTKIELHNAETAPDGAGDVLSAVKQQLGFVPNLFRALANSPTALSGFTGLLAAYENTSLSKGERQLVQLAASMENQCSYCIAGHSVFALSVGVGHDTVSAIRQNRPLPDPHERALIDFCREVIRQRGRVSDPNRARFLEAGYTQAQMLEVVLGIAIKMISNYAYGLFDFPLDAQFQPHAWPGETEVDAA